MQAVNFKPHTSNICFLKKPRANLAKQKVADLTYVTKIQNSNLVNTLGTESLTATTSTITLNSHQNNVNIANRDRLTSLLEVTTMDEWLSGPPVAASEPPVSVGGRCFITFGISSLLNGGLRPNWKINPHKFIFAMLLVTVISSLFTFLFVLSTTSFSAVIIDTYFWFRWIMHGLPRVEGIPTV